MKDKYSKVRPPTDSSGGFWIGNRLVDCVDYAGMILGQL